VDLVYSIYYPSYQDYEPNTCSAYSHGEKKLKQRSRWRLVAGLATAVLFIVALIGHAVGQFKFDEVALALLVGVIGSIMFAVSQQLGIAKIAAGPFEIDTAQPIKQALADLPAEQAEEVQRVLDKYSDLFPVIGVRLLWVDDCPETLIPQRRLLRRIGVEVVAVKSTEAAIMELARDGDFIMIIQDHLRYGSIDDTQKLIRWQHAEGEKCKVAGIPLVIFSFDSFNRSMGVEEWNWITQDFASLLNRIAKEIQQWKKFSLTDPKKPVTF
jgi:hypothetical protein